MTSVRGWRRLPGKQPGCTFLPPSSVVACSCVSPLGALDLRETADKCRCVAPRRPREPMRTLAQAEIVSVLADAPATHDSEHVSVAGLHASRVGGARDELHAEYSRSSRSGSHPVAHFWPDVRLVSSCDVGGTLAQACRRIALTSLSQALPGLCSRATCPVIISRSASAQGGEAPRAPRSAEGVR